MSKKAARSCHGTIGNRSRANSPCGLPSNVLQTPLSPILKKTGAFRRRILTPGRGVGKRFQGRVRSAEKFSMYGDIVFFGTREADFKSMSLQVAHINPYVAPLLSR